MELPTNRPSYAKSLEIIDPETGEVRVEQVHDDLGRELPDPVPMAPPLGYTPPLSMFDQMRAQIRAEHNRLRMMELEQLAETPEQANDFDVDEDIENMPSIYEERFDPVDLEVRSRLRQAEFAASYKARVDGLPEEQRKLLDGSSLNQERGQSDQRRDVGADRESQPRKRKDKAPGVSGSVREGSSGVEDGDPED